MDSVLTGNEPGRNRSGPQGSNSRQGVYSARVLWAKLKSAAATFQSLSAQYKAARVEFARFLETIPFATPRVTVLTNTTGKVVSDPVAIREALVRQVVSSVLWEDCMREAARLGATEFWECGPGAVLAGLARRINRDWPAKSFAEFTDLSAA